MPVSTKLLVLVALLAAACGSRSSQEGVTESFSALYEEIIVERGCVKCHDQDAPGGLDMTNPDAAYLNLVGAPAQGTKCAPSGMLRVNAGDSDMSLLVHKLEGHDETDQPVCGKPMPQMESLAAADIERVRNWIDQGAENQ